MYFEVTDPSSKMALNGYLVRCAFTSTLHVMGLQTLANISRHQKNGRPKFFATPINKFMPCLTPIALFVAIVSF